MILPGWPTLGWDFWATLAIGGGFGFCLGYFVAVILKTQRQLNEALESLSEIMDDQIDLPHRVIVLMKAAKVLDKHGRHTDFSERCL